MVGGPFDLLVDTARIVSPASLLGSAVDPSTLTTDLSGLLGGALDPTTLAPDSAALTQRHARIARPNDTARMSARPKDANHGPQRHSCPWISTRPRSARMLPGNGLELDSVSVQSMYPRPGTAAANRPLRSEPQR